MRASQSRSLLALVLASLVLLTTPQAHAGSGQFVGVQFDLYITLTTSPPPASWPRFRRLHPGQQAALRRHGWAGRFGKITIFTNNTALESRNPRPPPTMKRWRRSSRVGKSPTPRSSRLTSRPSARTRSRTNVKVPPSQPKAHPAAPLSEHRAPARSRLLPPAARFAPLADRFTCPAPASPPIARQAQAPGHPRAIAWLGLAAWDS
jgi:hypothetical protein